MKKRQVVTGAVLKTIGVVGVISVALLAPNALQMLTLFKRGRMHGREKYYINSAIKKLHDRGLIVYEKRGKQTVARLTVKGETLLARLELGEYKIKKPKRWDKKYRIVIFDIKEKRRGDRDRFRVQLEILGFVKLQNSVWVYPYKCDELISLIKAGYKIGKDILYIEASNIENDTWLRRYFGLPLK